VTPSFKDQNQCSVIDTLKPKYRGFPCEPFCYFTSDLPESYKQDEHLEIGYPYVNAHANVLCLD